MAVKNVALIGAKGRLGPSILNALIRSRSFNITVISRKASKSQYPDSVQVRYIFDDPTHAELLKVFQGQDAVIVTFAGSNSDLQIRLADAAAESGVKRFIPADFGSCDSSSPRALELVPLYKAKTKVRDHLIELAGKSNLTWTSLVCGHFFDYGLKSDLLNFDVNARKVRIFDGGDIKWSTTTLETIGRATVEIIKKEGETRNRMLYIQSFSITQNEVLKSVEKAMGQKWQVEHVRSEDFITQTKAVMDKDPEDADAVEQMVSVVGIVDADWTGKPDFANDLLGLDDENLDEVVQRVVTV